MSSLKSQELLKSIPRVSSRAGERNKTNGKIYRAKIELDDYAVFVPVFIPDLDDVRDFANRLHARQAAWQGEAFGWDAVYHPSSSEPPPDSKMTFTPAEFSIGDGALWFFALMWEDGDDKPPTETVYDENLVSLVEA